MTSTRTINNTAAPFLTPGGDAINGASIVFTLVDAAGQRVDAWDAITHERIVGRDTTTTDSSGKFSLAIIPNDRLGPINTWYRVSVDQPGAVDFLVQIPTGNGSALTWSEVFELGVNTISAPTLTAITSRVEAIEGGATVTDARLREWTEGGDYELTAITYDGTYTTVVSSATVKWPDTSGGTFTTTSINTTWLAIDAYTITHTLSGHTITQAAVTRNADGNVTTKPALTIA